ncbi:stAR-related lipid transfer protein 13-like isoform X2 [Stigmatopora argus]
MTTSPRRTTATLQLRRSISEQLRESTAKAWDLLWRNVRERRLAELEAKEACDWLRAAGFPQYAQLYEESQFPLDISLVRGDHDFLDGDLVEPLSRRLDTLNKCAAMKLDVSHPKKKGHDCDEDHPMAISQRWTFEWSSRRWSRLQDFLSEGAGESAPSRPSERGPPAGVSSAEAQPRHLPGYNSLPLRGGRHGRAGRSRAKDFLRRMELMRTWGPSTTRNSSKRGATPALGEPGLPGEEPPAPRVPQRTPVGRSEPEPAGEDAPAPSPPPEPARGSGRPSPWHGDPVRWAGERHPEEADSPAWGPRKHFRSHESLLVHVPKDHKPGTFPKALSIESLAPGVDSGDPPVSDPDVRRRRPSRARAPRGSRVSVYDNVPGSHLYASTGDLPDLEKEDGPFPHLDDILRHVSGLQQIVDRWSRGVLAEGGTEDDGGGGTSGSGEGGTSGSGEGGTAADGDSVGTGRDRRDSGVGTDRDRRDSGVGASLTRPRARGPGLRSGDDLGRPPSRLHIDGQTAAQLGLLHKVSLLRLTAIMEKHSVSNKHGWTWSVPKFMRRIKSPEPKERSVFGVPLMTHVRRCGFPLPLCLQQALAHLTRHCLDQVGLFRKSGVKSRIQALRVQCDSSPDRVDYEQQSAYDVADMLKQFFRDLPEPLLSNKLGETFLYIYQYVPKEQRLQAVRAAILLMADENRQALQTLLYFLRDVTAQVAENQMTAANLAICLAPSLFHLGLTKTETPSPRSIQRKYAGGRPDQKDLNENMAATQGLAHMIGECQRLFQIPEEMVSQSRNSYVEAELRAPPLDRLGKAPPEDVDKEEDDDDNGDEELEEGSHRAHVEKLIQDLLKETKDKSKAWICRPTGELTELAFKKVADGNPLRRWRVSTEVAAAPDEVLHRLLRERPLWQSEVQQEKVVETLDEQTDVYRYSCRNMAPQPRTDFVVLRSWRRDSVKGWIALACVSVDHDDCPRASAAVRAVVLESHYLLESCGAPTRTRLTHLSRVDLRGRAPEWYNKAYGHLCANEAQRIRASFLDAVEPAQ